MVNTEKPQQIAIQKHKRGIQSCFDVNGEKSPHGNGLFFT